MKESAPRFFIRKGIPALLGAFALSFGFLWKAGRDLLNGKIAFIEVAKGFALTAIVGAGVALAYTYYRPVFRKLGRYIGDALTGALSCAILILSIYGLTQIIDPDSFQPKSLFELTLFISAIGAVSGLILNITKLEIDFGLYLENELEPEILENEFFGRLTFMKMKDPSKSYFEGTGLFKPTGEEIDYLIDADATGPTIEQHDFYTNIQNTYDEIILKVSPVIEKEFKNWKEDFQINDFKKEFKLVGLTIPRQPNPNFSWDMSFDSVHDEEHQFTIDFDKFEPVGVSIDG